MRERERIRKREGGGLFWNGSGDEAGKEDSSNFTVMK